MAAELPSFTEAQWLASADPSDMISVIFPKSTERQMRLFMTACCRRVWEWMPEASRQGLEVMEQVADNLGQREKFAAAFPQAAFDITAQPAGDTLAEWYAAEAVSCLNLIKVMQYYVELVAGVTAAVVALNNRPWPTGPAFTAAVEAARPHTSIAMGRWREELMRNFLRGGPQGPSQFRRWTAERKAQAELLRHIVGNPFRPYPAPDRWPSTVVELAQAVYDGHGDHRVLSDAVEDAGHAELAAHFRQEDWHPKGCWGLDLILGKGR